MLLWYGNDFAIQEKALGKKHPHTSITYNNIVNINKRIEEMKIL